MARYFILEGALRGRYDELEKEEFTQLQRQGEELCKRGIKGTRSGRDGSIISLLFEEGRKPDDVAFVRARKDLPKEEVRPHGKNKNAKEWREFLKGLKVTVSASAVLVDELELPTMVFTRPSKGGFSGMVMSSSRIARVGPEVVSEVPTPHNYDNEDPDSVIAQQNEKAKKFEANGDMREIKVWEFEKLKDDHKDYKHEGQVYTLT